nr:hypothetical protein [Polaromonas sp. AER18D-145]
MTHAVSRLSQRPNQHLKKPNRPSEPVFFNVEASRQVVYCGVSGKPLELVNAVFAALFACIRFTLRHGFSVSPNVMKRPVELIVRRAPDFEHALVAHRHGSQTVLR